MDLLQFVYIIERLTGLEPALSVWQADVQPKHFRRELMLVLQNHRASDAVHDLQWRSVLHRPKWNRDQTGSACLGSRNAANYTSDAKRL